MVIVVIYYWFSGLCIKGSGLVDIVLIGYMVSQLFSGLVSYVMGVISHQF